ncbi:MAG TPA: hypothetical protein VN025_12955 [Candidatus Dormibacteraeota bacterium]|nr:hypothetical protein [Candidatus Dormibacteraeota bacterium]
MKHPVANLCELGNQPIRISSSERRRIYFGNQQGGYCQISTASKAGLLWASGEPDQLALATAHTTVTDRLLDILQVV